MVVSVVSIVVLSAISINIGQQIVKKDVAQRLNVIASDRMQALKNIWNLRLEQAESLAADPSIREFLAKTGAQTTEESSTIAMEKMTEFAKLTRAKDTTFLAVQIADPEGRLLASTAAQGDGKTLDRDIVGRASFRPLYTVSFDDDLKMGLLTAIAPVYDPGNTTPIGFVSVQRDLNTANGILTDKLFLGDTGEIYLVNEKGLMITDSRFMKEAKNNQIVDSPPVQECFRNGADVVGALYSNYRAATVFGASNCDRNLGIVLVSEVERDEMFSPILTVQYQYLLIAGAIIGAAGAAAFFLSRSILGPLQSLRTTMGKVQGGLFEKVDIVRRDEIGELATSFNAMVEEIGIKTKKIQLKNDILSFMSSRLEVQADALRKADMEKEEFASMVSHELKTFLVPIIGYSELLLDGTLGEMSSTQRQKVVIMLERAWSLLYLTQNILDARQLETKELKMSINGPVSVKALIEECASRALPLAKSRNLEVATRADAVTVSCDSKRVLQVLDNLVNNAIKATLADGQSGIIEVQAKKQEGDQVVFSVKDNGTGIPKEKQQNLFRKFYQVDKSLTRQAGGSGLGLAISKGIVEAHGGKMWFESTQGAGSTFYFSIPLAGAETGKINT